MTPTRATVVRIAILVSCQVKKVLEERMMRAGAYLSIQG